MTAKLLICPYFGDHPPWMPHWYANTERMRDHGYDFLFDTDEDDFRQRVREILAIEPPPMWGTGRVWNFRPAFGVLYAQEIADANADFWGHTDFDCVYGRVENWVTDEFLAGVDIHSNHDTYICGPWTLYRDHPAVNNLFQASDEWVGRMEGDDFAHGWAEKGFTELVNIAHRQGIITVAYTKFQTDSQDDFSGCRLDDDGVLWDGDKEAMMLHFRRVKQYPPGCVLS